MRSHLSLAPLAIALLTLLGARLAPTAGAQGAALRVDRFTVHQGLAQNNVTAVAQDRAGFVWAGTPRGLQRFDGYAFVRYASLDSAAPRELEERISALLVDAEGTLWVATPRAIFRRAAHGRRLTRLPLTNVFTAWAPDSVGRLWVLDGGALRWVARADTGARLVTVRVDAPAAGCPAVATSRAGGLWIGCERDDETRVVHLDPATGARRTYRAAEARGVRALAEDAIGRVWLGGNGGLTVLEPGATRFRAHPVFRGTVVGDVRPQRDGGVLVLAEEMERTTGAVSRLDRAGRVTQQWTPREVFAQVPLAHQLMVDREGGFWIATVTQGLARLDVTRPVFDQVSSRSGPRLPFASDFVVALHESLDGSLWVGTLRGGAYRVAPDWGRLEAFLPDARDSDALPSVDVWDFEEDAAGNVWIATSLGICRWAPPGLRCHRASGVEGAGGSSLAADADGWFWLARSRRGVIAFDPASGRFGAPVPTSELAITVYADRDSGYLWMGGEGLRRVKVKHGQVAGPIEPVPTAQPASAVIFEVQRDHEGALWLASEAGLQRWDVAARRFARVEVPELRGTTVYSIEEDADGRFWLGTGHGLVQYSPATGISRRYRREDGVTDGEFNRRAALLRRSGEMVFGGVEGLTVFRPSQVTGHRGPTPVVFTRWRRVTAQGVVETALDGVDDLRVGPGDRAVTLEFTALAFAQGPARRYRYRLEGVNAEWVESTERTVTFASLPPGRLVFHVQAAAGAEGWDEPGASLRLHVVPPVWRTWWFRALAAAVLLALAWALHRARLRRALETERLRLRISRDLHDEIGAGLSGIALLSDAAGGGARLPERERAQLQRIGRSARRMAKDLRDIVWAIDPDADRLEMVVSRMRDVADDLLPQAQVRFHAPPAEALSGTVGMAARRDLLLIYQELLHNVARHAQASAVDIHVVVGREEIELQVSDDGRGFEPAAVRAGTGLKSMRERATRVGARLDLTSARPGGTTARVIMRRA